VYTEIETFEKDMIILQAKANAINDYNEWNTINFSALEKNVINIRSVLIDIKTSVKNDHN